eukprot:1160361-Pelagomonas_calceolata.AAC.4
MEAAQQLLCCLCIQEANNAPKSSGCLCSTASQALPQSEFTCALPSKAPHAVSKAAHTLNT